jgi:hypothetical protein
VAAKTEQAPNLIDMAFLSINKHGEDGDLTDLKLLCHAVGAFFQE